MEVSTVLLLTEFNKMHKKMNVLYHDYAKKIGLSDAAFWLIYSLYENSGPCTQRDLSEAWFYAPQTINSALKALERDGIIRLELAQGNRKNKRILLTEAGKRLVKEKIEPLVLAEEQSFLRLCKEDREKLLEISSEHVKMLAEEINKIG